MSSRHATPLFDAIAPVCQLLESRTLLCAPHMLAKLPEPPRWSDAIEAEAQQRSQGGTHIVWTNRNETSDNFAATFGTKAEDMREIVDAALLAWQQVIFDWNRSDGSTTLQITISMDDPGSGFGGAAGPNSDAPSDGKPRTGSMTIGAGTNTADPNDSNGWFADPSPFDNAEFLGDILNGYAGRAITPSGTDFFSLVTIEMAHILGLISDRNNDGEGWQGYRLENFVTNTGITDNVHGRGKFFTFNGPTVDHLMTGFNGGDGGPLSWGNAIHAANDGSNIDFGGSNWRGTHDVGNGSGIAGRYLPSFTMAHMLSDAYGYTILEPMSFGTFYAVINETTGKLTIRGGSNNSSDVITVSFVNGDTIRVSVNVGNDVPGSGAQPGPGSLPPFVTNFLAIGVTSISIDAGDGNDTVNIESLPFFADATVLGGSGDDVISFAPSPDNLDGVAAPVMFDGGLGNDHALFEDEASANSFAYTIDRVGSTETFARPNMGAVSLLSTELHTVNGAGGANTFNVNNTLSARSWTLLGFNGNDVFNVGPVGGNVSLVNGPLTLHGLAGFDTFNLNNSTATTANTYTVQTSQIDYSGNPPVVHTGLEGIRLEAGSASDTFVVGQGSIDVNLTVDTTVAGNGGSDSLLLDDTNDVGNDSYSFDSADRFRKHGSGPSVLPVAVETITLHANNGNNAISVAAASGLTIFANGGNDSVTLNDGTLNLDTGSDDPAAALFGDRLTVNADFGTQFDASATVVVMSDDSIYNLDVLPAGKVRIPTRVVLEKSAGHGLLNIDGVLDLAGGSLLCRADAVAVVPRVIVEMIARGYNGGAWDGAHLQSTITSSLAAGSSLPDAVGYGLGSEIAIREIGSFQISPADLVVRYTRYGDTDLNEVVDFDDYVRTDTGFNNALGGWTNGDFDYNDVVDFDDYVLLDLGLNG